MDEVGVDRAANQLGVVFFKFGNLIRKLANFGGANEGKVEGPEEEHSVFAFKLV